MAGLGADYPPPLSAKVAIGSKLYLHLFSVPTWACHGVAFTFLALVQVCLCCHFLSQSVVYVGGGDQCCVGVQLL